MRLPPLVLVAVDSSDDAATIIDTAHDLFGKDAEYMVLSVADSPIVGVMSMGSPMDWGVAYPVVFPLPAKWRGDSGEVVTATVVAEANAASAMDHAEPIDAQVIGEVGRDTAAVILDVAAEHTADVIVVGSRDHGWVSKLISSSVSQDVLRNSPRPVLIVPCSASTAMLANDPAS
jgi:nucleotide-binding universal stress UspA family protein